MAKKKKVKSKGKIGKFSPDQIASMFMEEIMKNMVKAGIASADQIAAAEIEIQKKKETEENGKIDQRDSDRTSDVRE